MIQEAFRHRPTLLRLIYRKLRFPVDQGCPQVLQPVPQPVLKLVSKMSRRETSSAWYDSHVVLLVTFS